MDSPRKFSTPFSNIFFLFLLLSTNLVTFFFSVAFYSTSCTLNPELDTAAATSVGILNVDSPVVSEPGPDQDESRATTLDLPAEFLALTSPQKLPFGFNRNMDSDKIIPPVASSCTRFTDELRHYMSYEVNGSCPDDELLSQKLLLKGCEPLPRRRCRPAAPKEYVEPYPLPYSLWTTPSDSSVVWTAYTCKNYTCLINRKNQKGFDDCKDCFDLEGREKTRWTATRSNPASLDFSIDEVLALYMSISQRLPFFDNTLDIVHSMHVLSNWIPTTLLHFLFFDIYRVLRPGGLFWLDHFFCVGEQLEQVYAPLIESIGFNKVKWIVGRKLDRGPELREMYLSALLEKPLKNSW